MSAATYMPTEHVPVLAPELIGLTDPAPGETVVDATFGAGGHARLVAERIGATGELICVDRDPSAEERFEDFAAEAPCRTRFIRADYADAFSALLSGGVEADLVYFDLGVSSMQVDSWDRGFSYSYDAPLDMRMDTDQSLTAADLVNEWPERRLADVIRRYGEERSAARIARAITAARPLHSTGELVDVIREALPPAQRFGRGHPAKRTFQALRIAVNDELGSLDRALPLAWRLLRIGGRIALVSFHSLEDRRVKRFLAERARGCICPPELPVCVCGRDPEAALLSRGAIAPGPEEAGTNPRSRSAHLRAARKLRHDDEPTSTLGDEEEA